MGGFGEISLMVISSYSHIVSWPNRLLHFNYKTNGYLTMRLNKS